MSSLVEFTMAPLGAGSSVSEYVAGSLEIVEASGLPYQLHAMGTILEGDLSECLEVIRKCYDRMSDKCERISCSIKIDFRKNSSDRLTAKVASVENRIGHNLKT